MQNNYSEGTRQIERSILVAAKPDEVLDLLANPVRIPEWFADRAEWIADFGNGQEAIRIEWHRGERVIPDEILVTERQPFDGPQAVFAMRWEAAYPRGSSPIGYDTIARFVIKTEGSGARIVLNETGFGDGAEWDFAMRRQSLGWDVYLNALAQHIGTIPTRAITAVRMIPANAGQVWHTLNTPEVIEKWLNPCLEWDARLGGRWELHADRYNGSGWFTSFVPYQELGFSWSWYEAALAPTHARFTLTPTEDGTLLSMFHHGWGYGKEWDHEINDCRNGWSACLNGIRKLLGDAPQRSAQHGG